jgi:hypothetical protein
LPGRGDPQILGEDHPQRIFFLGLGFEPRPSIGSGAVVDDQNLKPTRLLKENACERFLEELEAIVGSEENREPSHIFSTRAFFLEAPGPA